MQFNGIIKFVGEVETFQSMQSGMPVFAREFLVETVEQYPRSAIFTLRGENAQNFNLTVGTSVEVLFDTKAVQSINNQRYYNILNAWRVTKNS